MYDINRYDVNTGINSEIILTDYYTWNTATVTFRLNLYRALDRATYIRSVVYIV